ncbi:MAG: ATP-dependent sacrificial sulfur transferase LarE [Candidatus Latescibacterota bacterium]
MNNSLNSIYNGQLLSGMDSSLLGKIHSLLALIKSYGKVGIAFSGGVDSTFLAKIAHDVLSEKSVAITVDSEAYPPDNIDKTRRLAVGIGIRLIVMPVKVCDIDEFSANEPDRCYHCKKMLFSLMKARLDAEEIHVLIDGSNIDDLGDYRPGMRALSELEVHSPLLECGFAKSDIRNISRMLCLPTWNMQSSACLASRFPYGVRITPELLEKIWKAESVLAEMGFLRFRVRDHGDIARIEIDSGDMKILLSSEDNRKKLIDRLKDLGYTYITLDLQGYRMGSMNESIPSES